MSAQACLRLRRNWVAVCRLTNCRPPCALPFAGRPRCTRSLAGGASSWLGQNKLPNPSKAPSLTVTPVTYPRTTPEFHPCIHRQVRNKDMQNVTIHISCRVTGMYSKLLFTRELKLAPILTSYNRHQILWVSYMVITTEMSPEIAPSSSSEISRNSVQMEKKWCYRFYSTQSRVITAPPSLPPSLKVCRRCALKTAPPSHPPPARG